MKKLSQLSTKKKVALGVGVAALAFLGYKFFTNSSSIPSIPGITNQTPEDDGTITRGDADNIDPLPPRGDEYYYPIDPTEGSRFDSPIIQRR